MPYAMNPSDEVRIYYEIQGEGPPLVLLHGTPGTLITHWRRWGYVEALSSDYRLVLIDRPTQHLDGMARRRRASASSRAGR